MQTESRIEFCWDDEEVWVQTGGYTALTASGAATLYTYKRLKS